MEDAKATLRIDSFGVSATSLEDVFFKFVFFLKGGGLRVGDIARSKESFEDEDIRNLAEESLDKEVDVQSKQRGRRRVSQTSARRSPSKASTSSWRRSRQCSSSASSTSVASGRASSRNSSFR